MVLFTRRTTAKVGQFLNAVNWAKEIADYINSNFGTNISVYSQRYGENPTGTIFWVGSFDTMSAYEEFSEKLIQDEGYLSKLPIATDLLMSGTLYDNFLDKH